jgi:hypothetical protein
MEAHLNAVLARETTSTKSRDFAIAGFRSTDIQI